MAYKEIKSLPISDFKNANHMAYMLQALTIIAGQAEIAAEFQKYLAAFRAAYEKEDEVMEKITFSEYTKSIAKADDERDKRLLSFNRVWRAYLNFPDEAKAAASEKIEQYWKVHKVVPEAQYDRETGQMINFIQDMRTYCQAAMAELGLTTLLDEMEYWNNEVNRLLLVRNEEYVDNKHIAVVEARRATDECYLRLVKAINAKAFLAEDTEEATRYDRVIDLMNQNIERTLLEVFKKKGQQGVNGGATDGTEGEEGSEETTPTKYTITFVSNGQTVASYELEAGAAITAPAAPSGYHWVNVPATMPAENLTIHSEEDEEEPPILS